MKYVKSFLPHLAIAMLLGLVLIVYLDGRNPYMAFLTSGVSKIYILILCAVCLIVSILFAAELRKEKDE